uniref:Uncharacterized protein n=1 Tax=Pseudomonas phage HRDY3 TaxID=3236930 RepID=A0AB39CDQ7_9VIRU
MTKAAQEAINKYTTGFLLGDFLSKMGSLIGSRDSFEESESAVKDFGGETRWVYRNTGPYGALTITVNSFENTIYVKYRSGAEMTRSDRFQVDGQANFAFSQFMATFEKRVAIAKVWHKGAVAIAEELLATVPTNAFRHDVIRRPSYEKSYPFCDFVLKEFPDVCMLRVAHDGFSLWQNGEFQRVEKWSDIDTRPITEVLEGEVQSMWRLGTGILFTSGTFERTEQGIKFVPVKRG